jgi:hypothetical protein
MNTKSSPRGLRLKPEDIRQLRLLAAWLDEHPELRPKRTGPPAAGLVDALRYAVSAQCRVLRLDAPAK